MRLLPTILLSSVLAMAFAVPAGAVRTVGVSLKDIEFSRTVVQIHRGDRVRWTWRDGTTPHDVTSTGSPRFRSSATKSAGTHLVTFRKAGTYRYRCTIHLNMRGRVVVR